MKNSLLASIVLILSLSACGSAPKDPVTGKTDSRKAAEVNTSLGQEYFQRGQYEVAMDKLNKAIEEDPSYAPAHTVLAVLHERLGQTDKAGVEYKAAVKAAPDNGDVNNNYGVYLCQYGRGSEADRYFSHAITDPFYRTPQVALANAGSCALQRNELDKAEGFLRKSLEYDAGYNDALMPMAVISFRQGKHLRARAFLQRYEASGALTADSLILGYRIETELGDLDAANRYITELLDRFPDSEQLRQIEEQLRS
jgi:type IV pilus assembly protein PilF